MSSKKLNNVINNISEKNYLGVPKDLNDWIKYEGKCIIFAAKARWSDMNGEIPIDQYDQYDEDDETTLWIMEDEEITKTKLIEGLSSVGVKCESVTIEREDIHNNGVRFVSCICYYNKPYEVYNSEFFIEGLSQFPPSRNCPLEFYFKSRID